MGDGRQRGHALHQLAQRRGAGLGAQVHDVGAHGGDAHAQLCADGLGAVAIGQALPKLQAVEFGFEGGIPQANSINANSVRVLNAAGGVLSVSLSLVGGRLQIAPPPGGWPTTGLNLIEIYPALRASDGRSLAAPLAIAFRAV